MQKDKAIANDLNYDWIKFPVSENFFVCMKVFCYENKLNFPISISNQKFENSMDLLLIISENKSYYLYIKDFDRFMFHKTKKWE